MKLYSYNVTGIIQCKFDILLYVQPVFYTRYNQLNSFTRMLHKLTLMCRKKLDDGISGFELLAILTEMKLSDINNIRPYIRDGVIPIESSEVLVKNDGSGLYRVVISEREWIWGKEREGELKEGLYNSAKEIMEVDKENLGLSIMEGLYGRWE